MLRYPLQSMAYEKHTQKAYFCNEDSSFFKQMITVSTAMELILYITLSPFTERTKCNLRCIQICLLH